jgi:hypothetical protein
MGGFVEISLTKSHRESMDFPTISLTIYSHMKFPFNLPGKKHVFLSFYSISLQFTAKKNGTSFPRWGHFSGQFHANLISGPATMEDRMYLNLFDKSMAI